MQVAAGVGAQADDIARIGRYLRLVQHHIQHSALALDCKGNAHAAADAQSRQAFVGITAYHFVQK